MIALLLATLPPEAAVYLPAAGGENGALFRWLAAHLVRIGPILLFVVCLLETAVFLGLVLPVGALIGFSSVLAARGVFDPSHIVLAAVAGGLIGDQIGFAVGRGFAREVRPRTGRLARLWEAGVRRTQALVVQQGLIGVSAARAVPFVRTIMPWFAGRSGKRWPRFFLFDLLGILLWATIYCGGGFLAGYGWERIACQFGEEAGAAVVLALAVAGVLGFRLWRRRLLERRSASRMRHPTAPGGGE